MINREQNNITKKAKIYSNLVMLEKREMERDMITKLNTINATSLPDKTKVNNLLNKLSDKDYYIIQKLLSQLKYNNTVNYSDTHDPVILTICMIFWNMGYKISFNTKHHSTSYYDMSFVVTR